MLLLRFIVIVFLISQGSFSEIELLSHQKATIQKFMKSEGKGLLIYHEMGTGKTLLSIGIAEQFPDLKILIMAPRFIEGHWQGQLKLFGVTNPNRYEFMSYHAAGQKILDHDLSNTLVILDEVHNLVKNIKSEDLEENRLSTSVYEKLRTAKRVVALTGTPIYGDVYDLAYVFNLLSIHDLVPFNEEAFRLKYTKIDRGRSYFRGFLTESLILKFSLPPFLAIVGVAAAPVTMAMFPLAIVGMGLGIAIPPIFNSGILPLTEYKMRRLNARKFRPILERYVSFYEIEEKDAKDFPTQTLHHHTVAYNKYQMDFFLRFVESSLDNDQLRRIMRDKLSSRDDEYLSINSSLIQKRLNLIGGSGREIGNLEFADEEGNLVESPKFFDILATLEKENFPASVVYSNYYQNGTVAFGNFLKRRGYQSKFAVLHPELSIAEQAQVVEDYNSGKTKVLLLHPEITEGISLKGTQQFHILEPVLNNTLLRQVTARAVRFKSHAHLSVEKRHVNIYLWESTINLGNPVTYVQVKRNWQKGYSELNDWSDFGRGLTQVDPNFDRKRISPDSQAYYNLGWLNEDIEVFKTMARRFSRD